MSGSSIFTLCFIFYQAHGAPQYLNLAWFHPSSVMNMQIRPHPNAAIYPALQEQLHTAQDHDPASLMSRPQVNDDDFNLEGVADVEPDMMEYRRTQAFPQQCDPRKIFQRSSCINSTYVRTCSIGGIYRDLQCPSNFNCMPYLGICMPPMTRRLQTFSCPNDPGTYPEPRNCMVYHECPQGNASAPITTTCFWPQIYDPITQSCQMETPERPCYKINCIGQQTVAYPGDPNIYATCSRSGAVQTLNRCDFGQGWIDQTQECEEHYCNKEGNIPSNEPTQYYTCSRIFKRLIRSEIKNCSTDGSLVFNATIGVCAPPPAPDFVQEARLTPSEIVETYYHEVPNVTDLVRKVPDIGSTEIQKPKAASTDNTEDLEYMQSPSMEDNLFAYGMPMNMIHSHNRHSPAMPPGMHFPNEMMPFLM